MLSTALTVYLKFKIRFLTERRKGGRKLKRQKTCPFQKEKWCDTDCGLYIIRPLAETVLDGDCAFWQMGKASEDFQNCTENLYSVRGHGISDAKRMRT